MSKLAGTLFFILISFVNLSSQSEDGNKINIDIGFPIGSQFIDKTFGKSGNSTSGGLGGLKLAAIYRSQYKLQFTYSNLDRWFFGGGPPVTINHRKDFNSIVSFARCFNIGLSKFEAGLSYLYVYERSSFPNGFIQFSSSGHHAGVYLGYQYLIGGVVGPYINYHNTPIRFSKEAKAGYTHNMNFGITVRI
jgi:hypothetical protein